MGIETITIRSFKEYVDEVTPRSRKWIFRGHEREEWPLASSLERALKDRGIPLKKALGIEKYLIRDFRRRYSGPQFDLIQSDTLYCMAFMQHHGAPTRLLDWNYSPYVAAKFALERGFVDRKPAIWCMRSKWAMDEAETLDRRLIKRSRDKTRNDKSFRPIFMNKDAREYVYAENALSLNERLIVQQGVFLCPGNVAKSVMANLASMKGWQSKKNVLKLVLDLDRASFDEFSDCLRRMNVSSASLFPGMDGFARSLNEHLFHFEFMAAGGTGVRPD